MERYVKLFNNDQAEVIAGGIYLAPVLTWESHGKKQYADITEKDVSEDFDSSFKMMKVNGWKQSVIHGMEIRIGGKDLAFVDMSVFQTHGRWEADSSVFKERGVTFS